MTTIDRTRRGVIASLGLLGAAPLLQMLPPHARAADRPSRLRIDALGGPGRYGAGPDAGLDAQMLADIRASGLTATNVTISGVGSYAKDYEATIAAIARWNERIAQHPDLLMLVRSPQDLDTAARSGRLGLIYGTQDATALGEDLDRVDLLHRLGVRVFQLTYNRRNLVGDGCMEPADAGLSRFGRELIERLERRRMLIDLSHSGRRTALEAIAAANGPVAITHTGCAALADLPRNKTDAELRLLAERGGVAGIYLMPFLRMEGQPMAADVIAHIEHALDVCGEEHVGIGTDGAISPVVLDDAFRSSFAALVNERKRLGIGATNERPDVYTIIPDLNRADRFERLGELLRGRGHPASRVDRILGGNFARLFGEAWAPART